MKSQGYLVLESGQVFPGQWHGGPARAGEVVFNTSHSGYEEMATDPSYFSQILVTTAPMQGNYGESDEVWESRSLSIHGFVCLELQSSERDASWEKKLLNNDVPILTEVDTRALTLSLRSQGTPWGALVKADSPDLAKIQALELIKQARQGEMDWAFLNSCKEPYVVEGSVSNGPKVALVDFGSKRNIVRELQKRCSEIKVFPCRTSAKLIREYNPDGILLSNGPGDPAKVEVAVDTVKDLLGWRFVFGICMGHQIIGRALGAKTYKLKFGHRGSNHPMEDRLSDTVYVTSQNHGYAVDQESLGEGVEVTHINLNDGTVAGIQCLEKKCLGVQFHPESHPGPHDAENLFDYFIKQLR